RYLQHAHRSVHAVPIGEGEKPIAEEGDRTTGIGRQIPAPDFLTITRAQHGDGVLNVANAERRGRADGNVRPARIHGDGGKGTALQYSVRAVPAGERPRQAVRFAVPISIPSNPARAGAEQGAGLRVNSPSNERLTAPLPVEAEH